MGDGEKGGGEKIRRGRRKTLFPGGDAPFFWRVACGVSNAREAPTLFEGGKADGSVNYSFVVGYSTRPRDAENYTPDASLLRIRYSLESTARPRHVSVLDFENAFGYYSRVNYSRPFR